MPPPKRLSIRIAILFAVCASGAELPADWKLAVDRISAQSLRGHLSFIASDALEGRATPSRGLDLAAEYIAAQYRGAGLEPAGDDGYFQNATVTVREPNREGFAMTVKAGGRTVTIAANEAYIAPTAPLN